MTPMSPDPGYWNQQFQFRKILPDFEDYLQSMERRSASLSLEFRREFQRINYGSDPRQWVEISGTPQEGRLLPVFIHGGYWRALSAEEHRFVLPALKSLNGANGANGAVANLEYRLLPHVSLKEIIADAVAGLRMLSEQTKSRLIVIGHSAGGHLATMAAQELKQQIVGVLAISGLYDLKPLQWSFLKDEIGLTEDKMAGAIPLEAWQAQTAEHITVAVGEAETPEMHRQAHIFASSHGAKFLEVPDKHHMTVLDDLADTHGLLISEAKAIITKKGR